MTKLNDAQLDELLAYVNKDSFVFALAIEVRMARQAAPRLNEILQKIDKQACPSSFCSCDRHSAGEALENHDIKMFLRGNYDDSIRTNQETTEDRKTCATSESPGRLEDL